MRLPHLASRLYGTPLLIARSKLDIILSVLGERIDWPDPQSVAPAIATRNPLPAIPGVAVIPVYGTLVRRALNLDAASGLMSYAELGATLDRAVIDPAVAGILLDVDSPGGEAGGVFELARRIREANAVKPVWAIASDSAYSAAYAIASAASRVYVTETAGVGSIGVIAIHVDQSARDIEEGYRYTAITAGAQKNDFSPHQPLGQEAFARLQAEVDRLYGIFVDHVAAMRKLEPRFVRSTEAGLYFGPSAVTTGLADAEGSFDSAASDFTAFLANHISTRPVRNKAARSLSISANPVFTPPRKEVHMNFEDPDTRTNPATTTQPDAPDDQSTAPEVMKAPGAGLADAVNAATKTARADAVAIAELCQLAGAPQRTAAFLAKGLSVEEVRHSLLASRAESVEITSMIDPDAASKVAASEQNPLIKAVKKLIGKD